MHFSSVIADPLIQIFLIPSKQYHRMFQFLNFTKKEKTYSYYSKKYSQNIFLKYSHIANFKDIMYLIHLS